MLEPFCITVTVWTTTRLRKFAISGIVWRTTGKSRSGAGEIVTGCSIPVLWAFAGNVGGLKLLDAGCGTGYLSRQASEQGAVVTGIDISERMIEIARHNYPDIDFRVDSCHELRSIADGEFDMVIANYVLMDTPDLAGKMKAFSRVLRSGITLQATQGSSRTAGRDATRLRSNCRRHSAP